MTRAIITVVGRDAVGIMAAVCTYLAEENVNILDINQTIVQEFFTMMMIADLSNAKKPLLTIHNELKSIGEGKGVQIKCQSEEVFNKMHRI